MLQFLCHPNSLPPVGEHRDPKLNALIKKSAFVIVLRADLFDLSSTGATPDRNPTATSLARKNDGKWRIAYNKLPKDKRLTMLKSLAVAQAKPAPAQSDDEDDGDFAMGQGKASATTQSIVDDLCVETGVGSGDEGDQDRENDDFENESENEGDEDSTTSVPSQTSKRQKNDESKPVGRAFRQTVLPGSDNSNSARTSPTAMLKAPRQEEKTPNNKKRKKHHVGNDEVVAGGSFPVDGPMEPIHEEDNDPMIAQRRIWKAMHKLGKHDIPPDQIQDPLAIWRARTHDDDHVDALVTSFQHTMKMNSKGVLLVLQDTELWATFSAMNPPQRSAAMEENSPFVQRCLHSQKAFRPFAGDHTRLAATKLMRKFPLSQKWKMFKGVKMYIADESEESDNILRDLGNMHNTIAALHRELAFKDKIRQIHTFFKTNKLLFDESGGKRVADGSGRVKPFLNGLASTWGVKPASMGQYVALGKLGGKAWELLDLILEGKYKVLAEGRVKALNGPPPKATSFFNKMGGIPIDVLITFFQDIVDGKLLLQRLPDACDRHKLMKGLKLYIVAIAGQARPQANIFSWDTLRAAVPAACTATFLDSWVSSLKMKGEKVTEAPEGLKQAIIDMCTQVRRASLILIELVSVSTY